MITIKEAGEKDFKDLAILYNNIGCALKRNGAIHILAKEDESILGFCCVSMDGESLPVIDAIFVKEDERLKGIGDGLLRATINLFRNKGDSYMMARKREDTVDFLRHEGMLDSDDHLWCDINKFFNKKCKGSRG